MLKQKTIEVTTVLLGIIALTLLLNFSLERKEKNECRYWQDNPNRVTMQWQKDQCEAVKIPLNLDTKKFK